MARLLIRNESAPVEILELPAGVHSVGRMEDNDFQICHPSVSSRHCEITVNVNGLFVRDLASTNGTFVDEQSAATPVRVHSGQTLRLGDVICEVQDASAEVRIPTWSDPVVAPLPGDAKPCANHPAFPASMRCPQCQTLFCGTCVHVLRRSKGVVHKLCPVCSSPCEPLEGMNRPRPAASFMGFLKKTFRLPRIPR